MQLRKATRQKAKLRIGLSAASGFGKTYGGLKLAFGITQDWTKIAVIDTEHGSAELYSDLGEYNVLPLEAPFSPERYIEAIKACENAGMEVIIIDSISHEWEGKGGCLEIQESLGGKYQDWAKVTPRHRAFIDAILQCKSHVITTVRRKQDYDMVKDGNKTTVQKTGTKEQTREGFEYELTVNLEIVNDRHLTKASKDRTGLFMGKPEFVITEETGRTLREWADSGKDLIGEKQAILKDLLENGYIKPSEKTKMLDAINTFTAEVLDQKIATITGVIKDREKDFEDIEADAASTIQAESEAAAAEAQAEHEAA